MAWLTYPGLVFSDDIVSSLEGEANHVQPSEGAEMAGLLDGRNEHVRVRVVLSTESFLFYFIYNEVHILATF